MKVAPASPRAPIPLLGGSVDRLSAMGPATAGFLFVLARAGSGPGRSPASRTRRPTRGEPEP